MTKLRLWGVRAVKVTRRVEISDEMRKANPDLAAKYDSMPEVQREDVARFMTGRNVGQWIGVKNFSGDNLTNMYIDAKGAVDALAESPLPNIEGAFVFEVWVEIP